MAEEVCTESDIISINSGNGNAAFVGECECEERHFHGYAACIYQYQPC
jgi:hypothetical protein